MIEKIVAIFLFSALANIHVNSLGVESILNGIHTSENTFKYQAFLSVRLGHSGLNGRMKCAAGIIGKSHVATVADCLHRNIPANPVPVFETEWYIVGLASRDLNTGAALFEVEEIFVPGEYNPVTHEADLAIVKIKDFEIDFSIYEQLEKLDLANDTTVDEHILPAIASGYGYNRLDTNGVGNIDYVLRYVRMYVTSTQVCRIAIPLEGANLVCGKSVTSFLGQRRGVCKMDTGAPLVIGNVLIGLASVGRANCDDTQYPTGFTRIKSYTAFIESAIAGSPPDGTRRLTDPYA